MTKRQAYTYVLLRYRHDPLAGEFANVGVVVHAPASRYLGATLRSQAGPRLKKMFPSMSVRAFRAGLQTIQRALDRLAARDGGDLLSGLGDAADYARRALPADDSSFVWGPVGSGLTDDPAKTLAGLYARFVSQYDGDRSGAARDDAAVWRPVYDLLLARRIADRLKPKTISSAVDQVDFEHAWKNGAWHVYQPLTFDLTTEDYIRDKAAKWAGHLLGLKDAYEPFKTHFIVGAPSNVELTDAYARALAVLRLPQADTEIVEASAAEGLVDRIEAEIRQHDAAA